MQNLSRIYFSIILLISLLVPVVIFPPAFDYVLIKLAVAQFLLGLFLILWLYQSFNKGAISLFKDPVYLPMLLLSAWALISLLFISRYRYTSIEEIGKLFTLFFLYFAVVNTIKEEKELVRVIICMILVVGGLSLHGLFYYFENRTPVILSTFGNQNFFSAYLILMIPITFFLCLYNFREKNYILSSILFIISLVSLSLVLIIRSHGAIIALISSIIFCLYLFRKEIFKGRRKLYVVTFFGIILISVAIWLKIHALEYYLLLQRDIQAGTLGIRLDIWEGTLRMIREQIFTGWGIGTYHIVYPHFRIPEYFLNPHSVVATDHAHNELLQITSEMGIIGASLFLWIIGLVFYQGVKAFNRNPHFLGRYIHAGLMAGVIAIFVHNLTCVNLRHYSSALYFYLFLGLISSLAIISHKERKLIEIKLPSKKILLFIPIVIGILFGWFYSERTLNRVISSVRLKSGIIARYKNMWDEAVNKYSRALLWNPYCLRSYYRLAYVYAHAGKLNEAVEIYKRLKELSPNYAEVHYNLGIVFLSMGRWLEERARLDRERGTWLEAERAWLEAERALKRAIELNPYNPRTHCVLAFVYFWGFGNLDKAIFHYNQAIFVQEKRQRIAPHIPDFGGGYIGLGDLWYFQQEWEKAISFYEKARKIYPKDIRILINLGNCYIQMNEPEKAIRVFEKALKKDPSLTELKRIIEELKNISY